jgi:hypothetical protein
MQTLRTKNEPISFRIGCVRIAFREEPPLLFDDA